MIKQYLYVEYYNFTCISLLNYYCHWLDISTQKHCIVYDTKSTSSSSHNMCMQLHDIIPHHHDKNFSYDLHDLNLRKKLQLDLLFVYKVDNIS